MNSPGDMFQSLQRHVNQTSKVHNDLFTVNPFHCQQRQKALFLSTALVLNVQILLLTTGKELTLESLQLWQ